GRCRNRAARAFEFDGNFFQRCMIRQAIPSVNESRFPMVPNLIDQLEIGKVVNRRLVNRHHARCAAGLERLFSSVSAFGGNVLSFIHDSLPLWLCFATTGSYWSRWISGRRRWSSGTTHT